MPATVTCKALSYSTPDGRFLFQDLNLSFGACRTGLVGRNGTGKSTLLKLVTGELTSASGSVSVTANVAPKLMHEMCTAAIEGRVREATALHFQLLGLHKQLFCEPSPAPTKWALERLGRSSNHLRLPLTPLTAASQPQVEAAMREAGLL